MKILCREVFTDTISKKQSLNYRWPFQWVFFQYFHKRFFYCSVLSFNQAIGLWVIDTCNPLLNTCKKMKLIRHHTDEFSALVIDNFLHWSLIWIAKQPYLQNISYKNWAIVGAVLSAIDFASDHLLK